MSALTRFISKELKEAFGATDNPKFNPMFKDIDQPYIPKDRVLFDVENPDTDTIAEFYSPMESAIENAPIGKAGTRGENIEAFVRKRAPKVTKGELDYREFNLEPTKKYTADEAIKKDYTFGMRQDSYDGTLDDDFMDPLQIKALRKGSTYRNTQRQSDLIDSEVGYEEVGIDVTAKDLGLMTHHGGSNLAHTRYSLRKNIKDGDPEQGAFFDEGDLIYRGPDGLPNPDADYILIEELQSDVIQNMSDNPSKVIGEATAEYRKEFKSAMEDIAFKPEFDMPGTLFEDFEDFVFNKYLPIRTNKKLSDSEADKAIQKIFEDADLLPVTNPFGDILSVKPKANLFAIKQYFEAMAKKKLNVYDFSGKDNILGLVMDEANDVIGKARMTTGKKDTPIPKLTDSIRVLLQSVIADAKTKGIDEIVLPPIEKLAEKRFPVGSKEYKAAIAKGSGFHNTYVVAFEKALKQLKGELGSQVKIGKKDLRYRSLNKSTQNRAIRLAKFDRDNSVTLKGTSINIKDLKLDPKKAKLRLNKGGLVQRPSA
jgi:hypothetical protein